MNQIVPPHLNAQVYKNLVAVAGDRVLTYFDYIKQHDDGTVLIGGSDLEGRYWDGHASIFQNIEEARNTEDHNDVSIKLICGTADGCFIGSSRKVLICDDVGSITIWSNNDDPVWQSWTEEKSLPEHDGTVLKVDCLKRYTEYVTVGSDGNIKVWDLNLLVCHRSYAAHDTPIYGLAVRPDSNNIFATGSTDQQLCLWNDNVQKPILEIKNDCAVETLQWIDENKLLCGDECGVVKLVDVRNAKVVMKIMQFTAPLHDMVMDPDHKRIAVCCDNTIVSVFDINDDYHWNEIYRDRHSKYVRGYAWDLDNPNVVHSIGWNSSVKTHTIVP